MMPQVEAALIDSFVVNRCWEAADTNALFEYTCPCVRAVATDSHAGLFPEILAVLPALEISRRLHTQRRRLLSSGDVGLWHNPDLRLAVPEGLLLYRGFGQALSGYVMPYSFCTSFYAG